MGGITVRIIYCAYRLVNYSGLCYMLQLCNTLILTSTLTVLQKGLAAIHFFDILVNGKTRFVSQEFIYIDT